MVCPKVVAKPYPSPVVPHPGYDFAPVVTTTRSAVAALPRRDPPHRLGQRQRRPAPPQPPQQRVQHVHRPVADREHLAGVLDLRPHPFRLEELDHLPRPEGGEGRVQELAVRPERLDDAAGIAVVGDVAPRPAGHENLDARLLPLFEQQDAAAPLGRVDGGHQPGRPGPDDDGVVVEHEG
jgi:hypothetical protein